MAKRKTVAVNISALLPMIKKVCRSNVVFCEMMGRPKQKTWVTEWKRNHNLPSPEEAVLMCAILNTTPEEILTEPADIALVNELIGQERAKQDIKKDLPQGEVELSDIRKEAWEYIQRLDNEQLRKFIAAAKALLGE